MAMILDAMAERQTESQPVGRRIAALRDREDQAHAAAREDSGGVDAVERHFHDAQADRLDGLRLDWPGKWLLVRASNTRADRPRNRRSPTVVPKPSGCAASAEGDRPRRERHHVEPARPPAMERAPGSVITGQLAVAAQSDPCRPMSRRFRHDHRAVGLLIVFQDRDQGPADGDGGAVERVDEGGPFFAGAIANAQPPGLIVGAIRGAGDFAIFARFAPARHPGFEIELAIGRPAQIAGGRVDDAIGNAQAVEDSAFQVAEIVRAWPRSARAA